MTAPINLTTTDIVTARFDALGTEIVVSVTDISYLSMVLEHTHNCIDEVDRTFSRFRRDSELERLHRRGSGVHKASPLFIELLGLALRASQSTDGLFDPTIRDALEAAGYDRSIELLEATGPGAERDAVPAGRWSEIELDAQRGEVFIPDGRSPRLRRHRQGIRRRLRFARPTARRLRRADQCRGRHGRRGTTARRRMDLRHRYHARSRIRRDGAPPARSDRDVRPRTTSVDAGWSAPASPDRSDQRKAF